jgi:arylsulfatase A-like enzyme
MHDIEKNCRAVKRHRLMLPGWCLATLMAAAMGCGGTDLLEHVDDAEVVAAGPVATVRGGRARRRAEVPPAQPRSAEVTTVGIDGDERSTLLVGSDVEVRFRGVEVKRGAVFEVGVAIDPEKWERPGDGILFRAFWKTGTTRRLIYSQYVDPVRRPGDLRWFDARVPLTPLIPEGAEGLSGTMVLATVSGMRDAPVHDGALWAQPRITYPWRQPAPEPNERPNVLLISLDTLRADHLGLYGHDRPTSPHIDGWAADAVAFTQVQAPANATLDSHMSIMTGLHPDVHAVRALKHIPGNRRRFDSLDGRRVTLAETMRAAGYVTAAFVREIVWLDPEFGFIQGFDTYQTIKHEAVRMNRSVVFPWLEQHRDEPFFLFVHYFDIHSDWTKLPYDSPAPFQRQFGLDYGGAFTGCGDGLCASRYLLRLNRQGDLLPSDALDYISRLYDGGIAYTDQQIGSLFAKLQELGLYDRTLIVMFADHGEEFQEHGSFLHEQLYQETVGVPLIIGHPTLIPEGRRIDIPVQTLDIMPTVLDVLGVPAEDDMQGRSLLPLLRGQELDGKPLFTSNGNGKQYAVREGDWKLIVERRTGEGQLYELGGDPGEQRDVSADYPERTAQLRATLDAWVSENEQRKAAFEAARPGDGPARLEPTDADIERLRNLGYVE